MKKLLILCLISFGIIVSLLITTNLISFVYPYPAQIKFGITFSTKYAGYLQLDWQKTYIQILDDLKVKNLRLLSYWDILESEKGKYDFSETDYMLNEAEKRGLKAILVLGVRQPRWPECHVPIWAKDLNLSDKRQKILQFIQTVVERYKGNQAIWAWQVENEPLLKSFGEGCENPDKNFLKTEVEIVRSLSNKPIVMTDSGELGFWITSMQMSDIFGTTVYRKVYDQWLGYMTYPIPPSFYSTKSNLVRSLFAKNNQKTIVAELQAEPWFVNGNLPPAEQQAKLFRTEDLKNYTNFVRKTGFDEVYFWGVEWWYFMAAHGHPEYLEYAKTLFR